MTQRTRSVSTVDETIIETIINKMMPKLTEKFNEGIKRLEKKIDSMEENMNGIVSKLSRLEGLVENMKISIIDLEKTKDKSYEPRKRGSSVSLLSCNQSSSCLLRGSAVQNISGLKMAVNFLSSVSELKRRENYSDWSFAVQNMLVLDDLKTCLDGSETSGTKNEKSKAKRILTIDPSLFVHVKDATSTKDLWTKLQKLSDDKGFCRKIGL
ncbi:hypothetical protein JTB14_018886 [Gonioctena quinquepunctata]|nr:hypothetical protein JTB14_018886 [Gonioctena quinquepunctata]